MASNPIKRTLFWGFLRRVIDSVEGVRGMTPAWEIKLLKWWMGYGTHHLVQPNGLYVAADFYKIAGILGYKKKVEQMVSLAVSSGIFVVGRCKRSSYNRYGVAWLASPVFFNEKLLKQRMDMLRNEGKAPELAPVLNEEEEQFAMEMGGIFGQPLENDCDESSPFFTPKSTPNWGVMDNIINITGMDNIVLTGSYHAALDGGGEEHPAADKQKAGFVMPPMPQRQAAVDDFIREVLKHPEHCTMFDRLYYMLTNPQKDGVPQPELAVTREQAEDIVRYIIYKQFRPYVLNEERFFRYPKYESRQSWFYNYIYSGTSMQRIKKARIECQKKWKRKDQEQEQMKKTAIRQNRPISPYEWLEADGSRYYEDPADGVVCIPADAAPRPSADALWNRFASSWRI